VLVKLKSFTDKIYDRRLATPKFTRYLDNLDIGMRRVMNRNRQFVTDPIPSAGIDFINSLLARADINHLLKYPNDMDRFIRVQKEYNSAEYSDFIRQYSIKEKFFFYSEVMNTLEYLLITDDYDLLDNLPIGSSDWNEWLKVRPVQLLVAPTKELRLDNTATKLRYEYTPPVEAVFSINIPKLLMLYTKYRLMFADRFGDNTNNYPFIYQTCILPLLIDLNKTWVLSIINDIVTGKLVDPNFEMSTDLFMFSDRSYFASNNLGASIKELERLVDKAVSGSAKPDEVFGSFSIEPGSRILTDNLIEFRDNHYIKNAGIQYQWMSFVKDYPLIKLMVNTFMLQPDSSRTNLLLRILNVVTLRMKRTKFWEHIHSPIVRSHVKDKFDTLFLT